METQITIQSMDQAFLFIRIISYSVGIINLVVMAVLYLLHKQRTILLSILLMIPFTIVPVGETWLRYLEINNIQGYIYFIPYFIANIGISLMIYVLPYFSHKMVKQEDNSMRLMLFSGIAVLAFIFGILGIFRIASGFLLWIQTILLVIAIAYAAIYGIITTTAQRIEPENEEITKIATIVAKSMVIFLPLLIAFDFFPSLIPIIHNNVPDIVTVLPFFYLFWNSLLLYSCVKNLKNSALPGLNTQEAADKYNLTQRERDVLEEPVQGKSYAEIADRLCVSLATVKTHINRIYKKTETKSRAELMRLMLG